MTHTRALNHLVKKGLKMHLEGSTWAAIASHLGIIKEDGSANPGLAYRIIMEGYIPRTLSVQKRLNLHQVCPTCNRPLKKMRRERNITEIPKKELLRMFLEREEI